MRGLRAWLLAVAMAAKGVVPAAAAEPADPQLIPEGRALLRFLESTYGKKVLAGQNGLGDAEKAFQACGRYPAIVSGDLSGWNKVKWSDLYRKNLQATIDRAKAWHARGGIVALQWHWGNPLGNAGTMEATRPGFVPTDLAKMTTPGTPEHAAMVADLKRHAEYLRQLAGARVPVLWRPLHEIDGGWFWWTDPPSPENTAALWRMVFNYLTKEEGLHHLIWVYSAGLRAAGHGRDVAAVDYRRRFYPGDRYVDIAGIDIYPNAYYGWGDFREDTYAKAWEIMRQVAPNKMLALCECQGIPNTDRMAAEGPKWLYALPWYVRDKGWNPPDWIRKVYPHEVILTLDELPDWKKGREKDERN